MAKNLRACFWIERLKESVLLCWGLILVLFEIDSELANRSAQRLGLQGPDIPARGEASALSLAGQQATVVKAFDAVTQRGKVRLRGELWWAQWVVADAPLPEVGCRVVVVARRGLWLQVTAVMPVDS